MEQPHVDAGLSSGRRLRSLEEGGRQFGDGVAIREGGEHAPPLLVRVERTELGTEFQFLISLAYARALGFSSLAEYEQWCSDSN